MTPADKLMCGLLRLAWCLTWVGVVPHALVVHEGKCHEANESKNVASVKRLHITLISGQPLLAVPTSTKCTCSQGQLVTVQLCQDDPI